MGITQDPSNCKRFRSRLRCDEERSGGRNAARARRRESAGGTSSSTHARTVDIALRVRMAAGKKGLTHNVDRVNAATAAGHVSARWRECGEGEDGLMFVALQRLIAVVLPPDVLPPERTRERRWRAEARERTRRQNSGLAGEGVHARRDDEQRGWRNTTSSGNGAPSERERKRAMTQRRCGAG